MASVKNSVSKISDTNWNFSFSVVVQGRVYNLCRRAYAAFVDISDNGLQRIINLVKGGAITSMRVSDDTPIEVELSLESLKDYAAQFGIHLTDSQLSSINMPARSTKAKSLVNWMDKFISVASCINPKDGKLQIELCGLDELYLMYVNDFKVIRHESYLGRSQFRKIFKDVFGIVVQVRKKKSVTGKCQICALLSFLRMRSKTHEEIESVSRLHAIHKIGFMGERKEYYLRRAEGVLPGFLSLITDGMAQVHCILPWMKGKNQPVNLRQHLQGTLVHGKSIYIYRTFDNVKVTI